MIVDFLSERQLKRLSEHKYSSQCSTILDPFMQKFWRWLVEQVPTWWAPNSITLVGLIINILTSLVLIWYSPDARQEPPAWSFILCAVGLFAYQSLDAIDGKQARRTNNSSPLGELFDHGCDAVSTIFVSISLCIGIRLGSHPDWMLALVLSGLALFYVGHWQAYVSGTLKFGKFDVTEAQFTIMLVFFISAVMGSDFWDNKIPYLDIELKHGMCISSWSLGGITLVHTIKAIFINGGIGKNGSTVAGTSVIYPICPLIANLVLPVMIYKMSETSLYQHHPCLFIIAFGLAMCKVTIKLVVAHMTKSELEFLDTTFIGPGMLFVNQYFNTFLNEYIVLWMCFFYCSIDLLRYSASVCIQICDYLDIYCFKIIVPEVNGSEDEVRRSRSGSRGKKTT